MALGPPSKSFERVDNQCTNSPLRLIDRRAPKFVTFPIADLLVGIRPAHPLAPLGDRLRTRCRRHLSWLSSRNARTGRAIHSTSRRSFPCLPMKVHPREYVIITAAFLSVLLSGYGIGHLVGQHRALSAIQEAETVPAWQKDALRSMERRLALRPEQIPQVKAELAKTAEHVRLSRDKAAFEYLLHIHALYERLIETLDAGQAHLLRAEKQSLEMEIDTQVPRDEHENPR